MSTETTAGWRALFGNAAPAAASLSSPLLPSSHHQPTVASSFAQQLQRRRYSSSRVLAAACKTSNSAAVFAASPSWSTPPSSPSQELPGAPTRVAGASPEPLPDNSRDILTFKLSPTDLAAMGKAVAKLQLKSEYLTTEPGAFTIRNHSFGTDSPGAFTIRNHSFSAKDPGAFTIRNYQFSSQ